MQKLTKSFLEKLVPADGKQLIIRDSELPGFGVRLSGKTKSWIVEKRVVGVNRRITFGNYPAMSCEEARQEARKILADIRTGVDPASAKENERIANLTLQEVLNEFLEHRNLKYWSRFSYRSAIERHLSDWLQLRVRKITRDMVEERHKAIPGPTRCGIDGKVS